MMLVVFYGLCLVGMIVLQIALIVAVFRTSRATQDTAAILRRMAKELRFVADIAEEVRPSALPVVQPVGAFKR